MTKDCSLIYQYMKTTSSEHVVYIDCFECQNKRTIYVHNISWVCTKVTVNKLEFLCNKKISNAALNLIAALDLERLLSARLRYMVVTMKKYLQTFHGVRYTNQEDMSRRMRFLSSNCKWAKSNSSCCRL